MKKNDPQLCICPFDPSYLTPVQLDINNRCVGRAEKERTQERRNNNAPVPLRAQMFNYSRKQQMALSSFNVCACDRDEILPQTKRNVGSNVSFSFRLFFSCCGKATPNNPASKPRSKWSVKLIPKVFTRVHPQSPVDVRVKVVEGNVSLRRCAALSEVLKPHRATGARGPKSN